MELKALLGEALATRKPIRREFDFSGQTVVAHFLDLPALEVREILRGPEAERDARLIAATLCDETGAALLTFEQAQQLRFAYLQVLLEQALSVIGALQEGKEEAKKPSSATPA